MCCGGERSFEVLFSPPFFFAPEYSVRAQLAPALAAISVLKRRRNSQPSLQPYRTQLRFFPASTVPSPLGSRVGVPRQWVLKNAPRLSLFSETTTRIQLDHARLTWHSTAVCALFDSPLFLFFNSAPLLGVGGGVHTEHPKRMDHGSAWSSYAEP